MKNKTILLAAFVAFANGLFAQADTTKSTFWHPNPPHYTVKQAFEWESLFPMFFTGGYHFAAGYRYEKFRVRFSVINGGDYDAEPAGVNNSSDEFKRYYKTSPGIFLGYNVWKNLELYGFIELHTFSIEQKSTGIKQDLESTDYGAGLSYQFFFGRCFYVQPGLHLYLRSDKSLDFGEARYEIPNADIAPVIRVGYRLWAKY